MSFFLASSTGQFLIYFFVPFLLGDSENDLYVLVGSSC